MSLLLFRTLLVLPVFIQSKFQSPHDDLQSSASSRSLLPSDLTSYCFSPFALLQPHWILFSPLDVSFTAHLSTFALCVFFLSFRLTPCRSSLSVLTCHHFREACVFTSSSPYLPWHSWSFLPCPTSTIPIVFNHLLTYRVIILWFIYCLSFLLECNIHGRWEQKSWGFFCFVFLSPLY